MLILHCAETNEMVAIPSNNPSLMINIFRQEDGMLISLRDENRSIEGLKRDVDIPVMDLYKELMSGNPLTVDALYNSEDALDEGTDENVEDDDTDW